MRRYTLIGILVVLVFILIFLLAQKPTHTLISYTNKQSNSFSNVITNQSKPTLTNPNDNRKDEQSTIKINNHSVPFTSQAPTGQWDDERQQDGCEEASALMAMSWIQGKSISKQEALTNILAISDYEQKNYGEYRDIGLTDVRDWIFKDYFKYDKVDVQMNIKDTDIIKQLSAGNIVLLPMNGQKLHNPYFTAPGPERHMIVIKGYDSETDEFITNDPGTKRGEGYRYSAQTIMQAILVYPTGYHLPADETLKGMLVVTK